MTMTEREQIIHVICLEIEALDEEFHQEDKGPAELHEIEVGMNTLKSILQRIDREVQSPQIYPPGQEGGTSGG